MADEAYIIEGNGHLQITSKKLAGIAQMAGALMGGKTPGEFFEEVADWLLATRDPRLIILEDDSVRVDDMPQACKEFCELMRDPSQAGLNAADWREHWKTFKSGE